MMWASQAYSHSLMRRLRRIQTSGLNQCRVHAMWAAILVQRSLLWRCPSSCRMTMRRVSVLQVVEFLGSSRTGFSRPVMTGELSLLV